ncbi:MAG: Uma2 family endonuclease [Planctomycetota bacterium]|jgi:Uma2 family endonuclease
MAGTGRVTTADELFAMADDDHRHELLHGELARVSPPGARHGAISAQLSLRLGAWVNQHDLGRVFVETGFVLARNPDHVRAPDVAFVCKARLPETGLPVNYWDGAPDFCAEVVSPGDTYAYVQEKACDWIRYGTRLVIVVEPDRRRVVVHRSDKEVQILSEDETLDGGDVVPGLELSIRELFAD